MLFCRLVFPPHLDVHADLMSNLLSGGSSTPSARPCVKGNTQMQGGASVPACKVQAQRVPS